MIDLVKIVCVLICIDPYPVMLAYITSYLEIYSWIYSTMHIDIVLVYSDTYPEPLYCTLTCNDINIINNYIYIYIYCEVPVIYLDICAEPLYLSYTYFGS